MQGRMGLARSRRAALLLPLQSQISLFSVAAAHSGETEKCLLPQVAAGGGILRVSLNTMLKY